MPEQSTKIGGSCFYSEKRSRRKFETKRGHDIFIMKAEGVADFVHKGESQCFLKLFENVFRPPGVNSERSHIRR